MKVDDDDDDKNEDGDDDKQIVKTTTRDKVNIKIPDDDNPTRVFFIPSCEFAIFLFFFLNSFLQSKFSLSLNFCDELALQPCILRGYRFQKKKNEKNGKTKKRNDDATGYSKLFPSDKFMDICNASLK